MMGRCTVMSAALRGVEAIPVAVEVVVTSGLPGVSIVGMADSGIQEARERVKAAIRSSGYSMPRDKVVINLAPAHLKKSGSGFDLPIALGILVATGQVNPDLVRGKLIVGELSLDGTTRAVKGTLAFGIRAYEHGYTLVTADAVERVPLDDLRQVSLDSLSRLHAQMSAFDEDDGGGSVFCEVKTLGACAADVAASSDFSEVAGHEVAKRAMQIAAAGGHGVLMMGPPGSGKTMLASRLGGILPSLSQEELLETAVIHSVAGEPIGGILAGQRPFRAPHHTATAAGLIGGGSPIRPGEISLAHGGVLFLDELAEFKPSVLQGMRQPMESGHVCLTRADGNVLFPARFMLVAASNPCPCGYFGDPDKPCTCSLAQIRSYQARIGGPLMDRIDIHLDVRRVPPAHVMKAGGGASSAELLEGVLRAREFRSWRIASEGESEGGQTQDAIRSCHLEASDERFMEDMARAYDMSGRSIVRTLGVARTIADMAESPAVSSEHIAEALGFRLRNGIGG